AWAAFARVDWFRFVDHPRFDRFSTAKPATFVVRCARRSVLDSYLALARQMRGYAAKPVIRELHNWRPFYWKRLAQGFEGAIPFDETDPRWDPRSLEAQMERDRERWHRPFGS